MGQHSGEHCGGWTGGWIGAPEPREEAGTGAWREQAALDQGQTGGEEGALGETLEAEGTGCGER